MPEEPEFPPLSEDALFGGLFLALLPIPAWILIGVAFLATAGILVYNTL